MGVCTYVGVPCVCTCVGADMCVHVCVCVVHVCCMSHVYVSCDVSCDVYVSCDVSCDVYVSCDVSLTYNGHLLWVCDGYLQYQLPWDLVPLRFSSSCL